MFDVNIQINAFLNHCKNIKALNKKTIKAYSIDLKQFAEYCDDCFEKSSCC